MYVRTVRKNWLHDHFRERPLENCILTNQSIFYCVVNTRRIIHLLTKFEIEELLKNRKIIQIIKYQKCRKLLKYHI